MVLVPLSWPVLEDREDQEDSSHLTHQDPLYPFLSKISFYNLFGLFRRASQVCLVSNWLYLVNRPYMVRYSLVNFRP